MSQQKEEEIFSVRTNLSGSKFFTKNVLSIEMKKIEVLLNKPAYLEFSILELSKILVYEFWYNYVKPNHGGRAKLCYIDTDSFIVYINR